MAINQSFFSAILKKTTEQIHIAPLALFRVLFGGIMFGSIIRFASKGWIHDLYVKPVFYFTYYGFEWVKPLEKTGMYIIFTLMAIAALLIMLGLFYRFSATVFFIAFTYVELIDKTNYLNHYYFVSIVSFLMILLPAARYFSLDVFFKPEKRVTHIPRLFVIVLQLQLGLVYFFAGIAKLTPDWLFDAMPLRIWLPPHTNMPVIGFLMDKVWIAYFFSWFGAIYDLSIPFLLVFKKTRVIAYTLVIVFHIMTYLLFQIGMFPYIMIICTLIFFSENFHLKAVSLLQKLLPKAVSFDNKVYKLRPIVKQGLVLFLILHFTVQILMPFRYLLYPGKLFWTEQGYRFSWRVMLMEKAGKTFFYITDKDNQRTGEAMTSDYLTANQEKMMATQPDMILQYAHFLKQKYQEQGIKNPEVRAECYVTMNGSGSRLFLDKTVDLTKERDSFKAKKWILPFEKTNEIQ
ncbi:MAG: HTTM domain-containing protein [Bacteroidota bacterium]